MLGYMSHQAFAALERAVPSSAKRMVKSLIPGIDRAYYSWLHRQTRAGEFQTTIQSGPLKNRPFTCSLRNERDYWLGTWEPEVLALYRELLTPGMTVLDVGAHIGYFTLIAAQLVGRAGKVYAFEPAPLNWKNARLNLNLNPDLASQVELLPLAISETAGTVGMSACAGTTAAALSGVSGVSGVFEVPATSIDDFIRERKLSPSLVKMDIEGGERFALRGMTACLHTARPAVIVEVHDAEAFAVFVQTFRATGYQWVWIGDPQAATPVDWQGRAQYLATPQ